MASYAGAADKPLTAEEYSRLPDALDYRQGLVRGRVVREPWPKPEHGLVEVRLAAPLHAFVERARLGVVLSNTGFVVETDPDTVQAPDLAFVAHERIPGYTGKYWRMAPDLAVEVLSPSNTASDIQEMLIEYLNAGARMVWVVDPRRRTVTVYRSARDFHVFAGDDDLEGDDVLPGFRLPLSDLFG